MFCIRELVMFLFFCSANCIQVTSDGQVPTILKRFKTSIFIKNCNIAWTNQNAATFLNKCDIQSPPPTNLTRDTSDGFLCMVYFDLNVRLCAEISKDESFKSKMPNTKEDVNNILNTLNSPEIAKDYCNTTHNEIFNMTSNITRTLEYVEVFVEGMSNKVGCELTCFEFNAMLNPFCKSILWITRVLNSHKEKISSVDKLNQYKQNNVNKPGSTVLNLANPSFANKNTLPNAATNSNEKYPTSQASSSVDKIPTQITGNSVSNKGIMTQAVNNADNASSSKKETSLSPIEVKPPGHSIESSVVPPPESLKPSSVAASHNKTSQETLSSDRVSLAPNQKVSSAPPPIPVVKTPDNVDNNEGINEEMDKQDFLDNPEDDQEAKLENEQIDTGDDIPPPNDNQQKQSQTNGEDVMESAAGIAGGAAPMENPINEARNDGVTLTGKYVDTEDSHFFPYFLFLSCVLIFGYVVFHNKNKVLGLLLEGRKNDTRRRCPSGGPAYRKLDSTLEEAVNSAPPSHTPHIVY